MNLSETISATLLQELKDGVYPVGSHFPSEYMLASRFNVNKHTTNKAVGILVTKGLLQRLERGGGTKVISDQIFPRKTFAFLCKKLTPYAIRLFQGAQSMALRSGCVIFPIPGFQENANHYLELLNPQVVQGILSTQTGIIKSPYDINIVYLDYNFPFCTQNCSFVNSDFLESGKKMMEEILLRNHREIIIFNTERFAYFKTSTTHPRINGFCEVMQKYGIEDIQKRSYLCIPHKIEAIQRTLIDILKRYPKTTVIATDSDETAELLWEAARLEKIFLGDKIAITGFGHVSHLPIASVEQYPETMGEVGVQLLLKQLQNDKSSYIPVHEKIKSKIVNLEYLPILPK